MSFAIFLADEGGQSRYGMLGGRKGGLLRRDWLRGHAEPGVVCEADVIVVEIEYGVSLVPVSEGGFLLVRGKWHETRWETCFWRSEGTSSSSS